MLKKILSSLVVLTILILNIQSINAVTTTKNTVQTPIKKLYKVTSVVDGDTVKITMDGKTKTLRLIGIDTPETVDPRKTVQCFGKEASSKTKELLLNKNISIESDSTQGDLDKYGRLLRYVFLENGTNFNEYMIKYGYAKEYTYSKAYKHQKLFKDAQTYAQKNKLGMWKSCSDNKTITQTNILTPNTTNKVCDCSKDLYNCTTVFFKTQKEAQNCYDYCFKITNKDIHGLDGGNKNKIACESLPK